MLQGIIIGKGGQEVDKLKEELKNITRDLPNFYLVIVGSSSLSKFKVISITSLVALLIVPNVKTIGSKISTSLSSKASRDNKRDLARIKKDF